METVIRYALYAAIVFFSIMFILSVRKHWWPRKAQFKKHRIVYGFGMYGEAFVCIDCGVSKYPEVCPDVTAESEHLPQTAENIELANKAMKKREHLALGGDPRFIYYSRYCIPFPEGVPIPCPTTSTPSTSPTSSPNTEPSHIGPH